MACLNFLLFNYPNYVCHSATSMKHCANVLLAVLYIDESLRQSLGEGLIFQALNQPQLAQVSTQYWVFDSVGIVSALGGSLGLTLGKIMLGCSS